MRAELAWARVVVTEIGWDGRMRRRALDTTGAGRRDNPIDQLLAFPLRYRAPAVRIPASPCRPAPEQGARGVGRRAHRLEPDPATAPVVAWMFAQRLAGHSTARITRALNDARDPVPSAADPGRNPHRAGTAWTLRTVSAILANPRYTGRQARNQQRTDFDLVDPANTGLGHKQVQRWNLPERWVTVRARAGRCARWRRWGARLVLRGGVRDAWARMTPTPRLITSCAAPTRCGSCRRSPTARPAAGAAGPPRPPRRSPRCGR
jgi:hypothetical protein